MARGRVSPLLLGVWAGAVALVLSSLLPIRAPTTRAQTLSEFPTLPNLGIGAPVLGADNALWFIDSTQDRVGRVSTTGVVTEFPSPTSPAVLVATTLGPDGAVWFTEQAGHKIGRITPSGALSEFPLPASDFSPGRIAAGPDGALWFTEFSLGMNRIGRMSTAGVVTEFPLPGGATNRRLDRIVTGPDGALWFTEQGPTATPTQTSPGWVGRITTTGTITEYPLTASPTSLAAGPDGAMWFTEFRIERFSFSDSKVGKISADGIVTEYPLPNPSSGPRSLVVGPDGALWFVEGGKIARTTAAGVLTEYTVPDSIGGPVSITAGRDGALWFVTWNGQASKVGRITTSGALTELGGLTGSPGEIIPGADGTLWIPEQGLVALVTVPHVPATSTASPTLPGGVLGGRNIGISPGQQSATIILWDGGTLETGYLVARYLPEFVVLPPGLLAATATSTQDGTPASAPTGTLYCYILGPTVGSPPTLAGLSNFACEMANTRSATGAPQNLTLRVTQSGNAALSWGAPQSGGQDGFRILSMSGALVDVGPAVGNRSFPLSGFDCFMVLAMRNGNATGNTDIACGLAGVSNLGQ